MKGIVFAEFVDMIEESHGEDFADRMLTETKLESNGVFTAIGTYPFSDMVNMLVWLRKETGASLEDLQQTFGKFIFGTFVENYPEFFHRADSAFGFLESIEAYIHVEVKKLYPDAELPSFDTQMLDDDTLVMIYRSERKMWSFAEGLIEKTLIYYQMDGTITRQMIAEDGSEVRFTIKRK